MPRCFYVFYKKKKYLFNIGVTFELAETDSIDKTIPTYQFNEIPVELQSVLLQKTEIIS